MYASIYRRHIVEARRDENADPSDKGKHNYRPINVASHRGTA